MMTVMESQVFLVLEWLQIIMFGHLVNPVTKAEYDSMVDVDVAALTVLPQEQLSLAYSHEAGELNRYRWLSLSFLPTASTASCLMAAIGMECEQRLHVLQEVARQMELDACVNVPSPGAANVDASASHDTVGLDELIAQRVLLQAEASARETYRFFGSLLKTNATPELHRPFLAFVNQKDNEYRVIREYRASCEPIPSEQAPYPGITQRQHGPGSYPRPGVSFTR